MPRTECSHYLLGAKLLLQMWKPGGDYGARRQPSLFILAVRPRTASWRAACDAQNTGLFPVNNLQVSQRHNNIVWEFNNLSMRRLLKNIVFSPLFHMLKLHLFCLPLFTSKSTQPDLPESHSKLKQRLKTDILVIDCLRF